MLLILTKRKVEFQQPVQATDPVVMTLRARVASSAHNTRHAATTPLARPTPDLFTHNTNLHAACEAFLSPYTVNTDFDLINSSLPVCAEDDGSSQLYLRCNLIADLLEDSIGRM